MVKVSRAVCRTVRRLGPWVVALAVLVTLSQVAAACPTCSESLAQSDPSQSAAARGYYWSILFMMAMPFTLFGALGAYFYWEIRKARFRQRVSSPEAT